MQRKTESKHLKYQFTDVEGEVLEGELVEDEEPTEVAVQIGDGQVMLLSDGSGEGDDEE